MTTIKRLMLAVIGIGMAIPAAGCMPPRREPAASTSENTAIAASEQRRRRERHNRGWRSARNRAHDTARRGGRPRDVAREFERSIRGNRDININVCVINAIIDANSTAAIASDATTVVNVIDSFNCEF